MISLREWGIVALLKAYIAIALVIATVFSPLAFSFVPILLLIWYLYLWRWPISTVISLLTDCYMFFAIAVLLVPVIGPFFSLITSLPLLALVSHRLKEVAKSLSYRESKYVRSPTSIYLALTTTAISTLAVSLLLSSLSLLLASAMVIIYLGVLGTVVLRRFPTEPVEATQIQVRMVAGSKDSFEIKLATKTTIGGLLFVESPYEWLKVSPPALSLDEGKLAVKVSLSPTLSGPWKVKLNGQAIDRFGLIQTRFELEVISLYVIPRARYAAWLARKYLAETKPGALPLLADIRALKALYGFRSGVEYYGDRPYQAGDSLKNIDWKHSLKYRELITKEFAEFQGQPAVVLINLAVSNAEEADKLAYNIVITAVSLARENIPAALAAYNDGRVELTTTALDPRQILLQSLLLAREIVTIVNPVKYLNPPDVTRLRADINRLRLAESDASKILLQLLEMEYKSFYENTRLNPVTKALSEVFAKVDRRSSVVVISFRNHDAEALAVNTFNLARKGNAVITV